MADPQEVRALAEATRRPKFQGLTMRGQKDLASAYLELVEAAARFRTVVTAPPADTEDQHAAWLAEWLGADKDLLALLPPQHAQGDAR